MNKQRTYIFLLKITIFSLIISAIPLPDLISNAQPFWMLLLYTYWLVNFPAKGRLIIALILGLLLDILHGDILGQNALALIFASAFITNVKQSFYVSNLSTQQVYVFGSSVVYLLTFLTVHALTQGFNFDYLILISPLTGAILWPVVRLLLSKCRHQ